MKKSIIILFKGLLLGLDSTVPGLSMATLAVCLNIYEDIIADLSELGKHPIKVIWKNKWLILGFIIGIIINVFAITYFISHFPLPTCMFFVGLIVLSVPTLIKKLDKTQINIKCILSFIICLGVLVVVTLLNVGANKEASFSFWFLLIVFILAVLSSATMVIPGISGSLILMALGYYDVIINSFKEFVLMLTGNNTWDASLIIVMLLLFGIGTVLGAIFLSKLIKLLLSKFYMITYSGIVALVVGSLFSIVYLTNKNYLIDYSNIWIYVFSVITLISGVFLGYLLMRIEKGKIEPKEEKSID